MTSRISEANMAKLEQHLFDVLDRTLLPTEYGTALDHKDRNGALQAAVQYFRERPSSAYFADLSKRGFNPETAARAVQGNITVVNIPHQFPGGKIDFLFDPTRATGVHNPEWQWQLNRMHFWSDMALAYLHSHDETIAAAFAQQVYHWVTEVPFCNNWNGCGSAWRTIETGLRLMGSWQTAFEVFRKSPSLPDETLALMLASMHEQTQHAMDHTTSKNWLMMELNGAHTFAAIFPEFTTSAGVRKKASARLGEELKTQLLPDGLQIELSPDYHSVVQGCGAMLYRIAKLNGCLADLPEDFGPNLERAANACIQLMTPGFTQPRTNDCFTMRTNELLKQVQDFFPNRQDFLWAVTKGEQGEPPAGKTASRFMPWAGFVAMRSSWEKDAAYLCFDVGPLGAAHIHQDKLNINIYKGGEELLFDDGGGQYESSPYRIYGISAANHNTVLVDGLAQYRKAPNVAEKEIDANFFSSNKFDYASGIYEDTFGEEMVKSATHKREVLFVKPDFFAVADTLTSVDGAPHDYTILMQLDTLEVKASSRSVHGILSGNYDLYALLLTDDVKVVAESAQNDPVSGWYVGRNDKDLHPATTVKVTAEQKKDFRFLTLFFPLEKGATPPTAEKCSDNRWQISFNGKDFLLDLDDLQANLDVD